MTQHREQETLLKRSADEPGLRGKSHTDQVSVFSRSELNIWLERWIPRAGVFAGAFFLLSGLYGEGAERLLMAVVGGLVLLWSSYSVRYIRPYEEIVIDQEKIAFLPQGHSLPLSEIQGLTGPSWLDRDDTHQAHEITLTMASERRERFVGIYRWKGNTCKVSVGGTDARGILLTISSRVGKAPFFV